MPDSVWIFVADGGRLPSGVFLTIETAERWIGLHSLTGVLTRYPIDEGAYDWAVRTGRFTPRPTKLIDSKFVGRFSSARMDHHHYESGRRLSGAPI
jgi:hypothetical protein